MSKYPFRVAIIGAGVSGLAAAVELYCADSTRDLEVTIFESRREAGGRTRSFIDSVSGDSLDNGQHLLMNCYRATLEYLKTIGTDHLVEAQESLRIPFHLSDGNQFRYLKLSSSLPVPLNLFFGILGSKLLLPFEKLAAMRLGADILLFRLDRQMAEKTCADLFYKTHQPETLITKLWEPIILATMNTPISTANAQVFLNTMRTVFLRDRRYSSLLFPTVGLSELLIDPAITFLHEHPCKILYGQTIESVQSGNNLVYVISNGTQEVFDALIYAGSYSDTSFLPPEITQNIPAVTFSPIVNAYFWINKKIVDSDIQGYIGSTIQWCFPKHSRYSEQLLACTVSAAERLVLLSNEEITNILWADIVGSIPYRSNVELIRSIILKEKKATPLLNTQLQLSRPKTKSSIKNIFFAGDLVQNGLPMTIEGAVLNGKLASRSALSITS